ncbi:MAG: hypothetical protein NVS3B24_03840 [Candidatus Dormibacteria bacterium]
MIAVAEGHPHPRTLGWLGVSALAMGGSNQSLFLIGALLAAQGSAAVPLLGVGLVLSWMAAPGWTELVLMWPNRVGGIAATCAEAFRPYSPVLANLTGVCYWWGWVPTCGLTALLSASAIHQWYLPGVPVPLMAVGIVILFTLVNLAGVRWVSRLALPLAAVSAVLAFSSAIIPVLSGEVNWHVAAAFHLTSPFAGWFGGLTSLMAGLYLVGFAAPAFEAATCHVGEMKDPLRDLPRAMIASAAMAGVYFIVLPVVWLGVFGPKALEGDLAVVLGPTFAPLFGAGAKAAALAFMVFNMFHGSLQPLAGASRTLSQLSEDGLLPRFMALRARTDAPWVATLLTAGFAVVFLLAGDPIWIVAGANLTYLIGIALPNVAVWLLRRDAPAMERPWRAPKGTIRLGLFAAVAWLVSTILGFQQFGLPTVLFGIALAYSGAALYALRLWSDRRALGVPTRWRSLHLKLTGAMLAVLVLDGAGYLLAVSSLSHSGQEVLVTACEDIFVAVALLTIAVGLVLPGMIGHASTQVAEAADRLAAGTLPALTHAMVEIGQGRLDTPIPDLQLQAVTVHSHDEMHSMAISFNTMQAEIVRASNALGDTREQLRESRASLEHLAFHDPLTGLANRSLFRDRVEHARARASRSKLGYAVLLLDLDNFKTVNDSLGHAAGDRLLRAVAERLGRVLRPGDTAARLGGDEFALLVEELEDPRAAEIAARRVLAVLLKPFPIEGRDLTTHGSVGVAIAEDHADPDDLLRRADVAMYAAKMAGKGGYLFFSETLHHAALERLAIEQDLRVALSERQFRLVYQPQVDSATGRVVGAEALVRWEHPSRGVILPDSFISVAEEGGMVIELDHFVLLEACRQAMSWKAAGISPLRVAVNVSGKAFEQDGLVARVRNALEETGLPAAELEIELTESVAVRQTDAALAALGELRVLGVRIAIDDFGTGYSMLSKLQQFPVDRLKIDRSFIAGIRRQTDAAPIVAAMISMAHGLGLDTVAEGVETDEQLAFLVRHRCDQFQGYLFSKAVEPAEFEALVRQGTQFITEAHIPDRATLEAASRVVGEEPSLEEFIAASLGELQRLTGLDAVYLSRADGGGAEMAVDSRRAPAAQPGTASFEARVEVSVILANGTVFGILGGRSGVPILLPPHALRAMELFATLIASRAKQDIESRARAATTILTA